MEFRTVSILIFFYGLFVLSIFDARGCLAHVFTCAELCFTTLVPKDGSDHARKAASNQRSIWCHIMQTECPNECAQVCAKNWKEELEKRRFGSSSSSSGNDD